MFTGIVQEQGTLASREQTGGDARLAVEAPAAFCGRVDAGHSVAVNGVCLTVTECGDDRLLFDVSNETLSVTGLGALEAGDPLNLEPALAASDPVGGHFVTGHVDGIGEVLRVEGDGRSRRLEIQAPEGLARYIAPKGCITVDGVSLTVNEVDGPRFGVNIVPHTLSATTLSRCEPGTRVNLEVDLIARYLERLVGERGAPSGEDDITTDFLSKQGFAPPVMDDEEGDRESGIPGGRGGEADEPGPA